MTAGLLSSILLAQYGDRSFWLPPQGSDIAPKVDAVFHFILGVAAFFFVLIVVLMAVFVIRYRRRPGDDGPAHGPTHSTFLELTWSGIPVVIVFIMFVWSFLTYMDLKVAPANPYEIQVTAMKWKWQFRYPNGAESDVLHVPIDRPVLLTMTSQDVIHSLFVPRFRIKMDLVPGRYTQTWFRAILPGEHDLYCAEYCGTQHSDMITKVVVHEPGEFEKWVVDQANILDRLPPLEAGKFLFNQKGCSQCHAVERGLVKQGPSLAGVFGHEQRLADGTSAKVDENYLRESMLEPNAHIVQGFQGIMPTFQGRLNDEQIAAIITYIKSLE